MSARGERLALALATALLGACLLALTVPGPFTPDEGHYIATLNGLRAGTFRLELARGLAPSPELLGFGGYDYFVNVHEGPPAGVQPPFWAFLAWPLAPLGWRGLTAINTAAFLATGWLVFGVTRSATRAAGAAWLATLTYWFAGFTLEYAVGLWPHALAQLGVFAAAALVLRARGRPLPLVAAGALLGAAIGIRYQEIVGAGALGTLAVAGLADEGPLARPRPADVAARTAALLLGVAPFLVLYAWINHLRLDSWNPISKGGGGYVPQATSASYGTGRVAMVWGWVVGFVVKFIDYSRVPLVFAEGASPSPSGAIVLGGVVKKALLQSAPWVAPATAAAIAAARGGKGAARIVMAVLLATATVFAWSGAKRGEGFCYNMRYLIELLPFAAVGVGLAWDELGRVRTLAWGALAGGALAVVAIPLSKRGDASVWAYLYVPLVLGALAATAFAARARAPRAAAAGLGACLAWGATVHLGDDLLASLKARSVHELYADALAAQIGRERTAVVAYWSAAIVASKVTLDRDVLVVDPWVDRGATARTVVDDLLGHGFRVLTLPQNMPRPLAGAILGGRRAARVGDGPLEIVEIFADETARGTAPDAHAPGGAAPQ